MKFRNKFALSPVAHQALAKPFANALPKKELKWLPDEIINRIMDTYTKAKPGM